uniref:Hyaluronan-mediated motility receptor C-terminal domain-containing protein n=1 Tax=Denticeps clupeoides TaxID=299321 RepID=A0AAY4E8R1_9TELE
VFLKINLNLRCPQIRSLVQQRGEQDRRLMTLEEDLKKLEAKLLVTVREKTGLAASVASLERQLAEVKKVNEFLKSKVSIDCAKKRINSLTAELMEARNKVDVKDKELSFLQISSEGQLKVLQTDLDACRATLYALKERNQDLEDLHKETKVQNEELENEINKLHAIIEELRSDLKVVQGYLDIANEEIQAETDQCITLIFRDLEQKLEKCAAELQESQDMLRERGAELQNRELDLLASENTLSELQRRTEQLEQELQESQGLLRERDAELENCKEELIASERGVEEAERKVEQCGQQLQLSQHQLTEKDAELQVCKKQLLASENSLVEMEKTMKRVEQEVQQSQDLLRRQDAELQNCKQELIASEQSLMETESKLKQCEDDLQASHDALEPLKKQKECNALDLQATQKAVQQKEEELARLKEVLRQTEDELDQRVTNLAERCQTLEKERGEVFTYPSLVPFFSYCSLQEQLDGFASERRALLEDKGATQGELSRLSDAYARLLGHQNHKQKIKHVMKMKQENFELKQEVTKLRTQVGKQKREMQQFCAGQAPPRFDPSKAFMHEHKENQQPLSTVRQGEITAPGLHAKLA